MIQYKRDFPNASSGTIASVFGVKRQTAHLMVSRAIKRDKTMPPFKRSYGKKYYTGICKYCGKEVKSIDNARKSHKSCFSINVGRVQLKCPICKTNFSITKSQYRFRLEHGQKKFYDSRKCLGISLRGKRR